MENLAAQNPERVKQMSDQWQALEREVRAQAGPAEPKAEVKKK